VARRLGCGAQLLRERRLVLGPLALDGGALLLRCLRHRLLSQQLPQLPVAHCRALEHMPPRLFEVEARAEQLRFSGMHHVGRGLQRAVELRLGRRRIEPGGSRGWVSSG